MVESYQVVWDGKGPLLPDREERMDDRYNSMPSFDLDDDAVPEKPKRIYNKTGRHVGKFSRTNPNAQQYKPRSKRGTEKQ